MNSPTAQEAAEEITYTANELNQYTQIDTNGSSFTPEYDANGNQTLVQTSTGIWRVTYNAENRAVKFESADGNTIIDCAYDYMGRRFEKKVTTNGTVTLRQRYLYRAYLQIACLDLTRANQPALWYITWDPTQSIATRPLAIQKDGTWYTYKTPDGCKGGWTCAKHAPRRGETTSECRRINYRYYNPTDGRWTRRDPIGIKGWTNLCTFVKNSTYQNDDIYGLNPLAIPIFTLTVEVITSLLSRGIATIVGMYLIIKASEPCGPCPAPSPPGSRLDCVPPSHPHYPCTGSHTHHWHYEMHQDPVTCICYEKKVQDPIECN